MKSQSKIRNLIFLLAISVVSSACAVTLRSSFEDQAKDKGWTKDQTKAAYYYGLRLKFTRENDKGGYDVYYQILPVDLAANIVKSRLEDLDYVLDYKNKDWAKYIKALELRTELEHQERILKAVYSRLEIYRLNNRFKDLMGERSYSRPGHLDNAYDSSKVFVEDVAGAYTFNSTLIDESRTNGTLKEIAKTVWFDQKTLGRKEPDPNDPEDPNKFVWRPVKLGLELVSYKVIDSEVPKDNNVDYVEGTRVEIMANGDMKKESKPALRLFVPTNGYGSILVVDKDLQGKIGSGLPDFVEELERVTNAERLLNQAVLAMLFQEPDELKRVPPKPAPPVSIEIARVGQNKIDVWETNSNGWSVPLKYKNDRADNYSVSIRTKGSEREDYDPTKPKQIASVKKTWDSSGNVVEYFHPKAPYNEGNIESISAYGKDLSIVFINGERTEGRVLPGDNKFVNSSPYAISYEFANQRWLIMDDDGDGKYEKKRQMSGSDDVVHHP